MKRTLTICLFLLGIASTIYAQSFTLKGTVVDIDGEPYVGVSVILKGTTIGISTDMDGTFELNIPDLKKNNIVEFRYVGTEPQEIKIDGTKNDLKIILKEDRKALDEVVVVGYAAVKKKDIVGASMSISADYASGERVSGVMISESGSADDIAAGTLTAGELSDFAKWNQWDKILTEDFSSYLSKWQIRPQERYMAQLTNLAGMPLVNAAVVLQNAYGTTIWRARTDNTGKAELWAGLYSESKEDTKTGLKLVFDYEGQSVEIASAKPFSEGINTAKMDAVCGIQNAVDIFFMVDATGSMGDEIRYLQIELNDIIKKIKKQQSQLQLRVGSLVYRDNGDEYVTRKSSLDADVNATLSFLKNQRAGGGGDYPEAVDEAFYQSIYSESWNDAALARIAFLVLDAPAHDDAATQERLKEQIRLAAEKGIRVVPIVCSGMAKDGEYLMRCIALATNGTYLFLTDDSGVGDSHMKPTTDSYDVEKLNDAIVRIVKQYTQMPNCSNDKWIKEQKKESDADKFVPNPSDEDPDDDVKMLGTKAVMKVYPNPCKDVLKVDIKKDVGDLFFVDMTGKSLQSFKPSKNETILVDVQSYAAGVYFVKGLYKGKWFTEKVIVSK